MLSVFFFFSIFNQTYPRYHRVFADERPRLQNLPLHWTFLRTESSLPAWITRVSIGSDVSPTVILSDREAVVDFSLLTTQLGMQADSLTNVTMMDGDQVYPVS